jgi:hypothetical protein
MLDVSIVSERIRYPSISSHGTVTNTPYHCQNRYALEHVLVVLGIPLACLAPDQTPVTADSKLVVPKLYLDGSTLVNTYSRISLPKHPNSM